MTQTLVLEVKAAGQQVVAPGAGGAPSTLRELVEQYTTYPDGTDAGKADAMWGDTLTIATGGGNVEALDLDSLGATGRLAAVDFAKIKGMVIRNTSSTGHVTLGGGSGGSSSPATDAWSDTDAAITGSPFSADASVIYLGAGDVFVWTRRAGVGVVASNGDTLGIEAFTAEQTVQVLLWGDD